MPQENLLELGSGSQEEAPPDAAEQPVGGSYSSPPTDGRMCPICKQQFSGSDAAFCPFDGEPLVSSRWDPTGDPLVGTVVDNRYEVLGVLGEGGMGTVYRIRHRALERPLALKALRRDLSKDAELPMRFIQEAKAAAAVEHPNVVQITDFGTLSTGQPYFVMELLEGDSLSSIIREQGPMTVTRAVGIAIHVAEALAAAHSAGVIHRDLKPDNIHVRRIGAQDVVKVLDFGLAKIAGTSRLTRAGMVFGTPHYMSPEQAAGEPSDHRIDIYALGVLLFEMLTGRLPFEAESFTGVLAKHMYMDPPRPSDVVGVPLGGVDDIVLKCMAKRPTDRYATMGDLLGELDRLAAMLTIPPEPISRRRYEEALTGELAMSGEPPRAGVGRRAPLIAGAVGLVAVVVLLGVWLLRRSSAEDVAASVPAAPATEPSASVPLALTSPGRPSSTAAPPAPSAEPTEPADQPTAAPEPTAPAVRAGAKRPAVRPHPAATATAKPKTKRPSEIIDPWGK